MNQPGNAGFAYDYALLRATPGCDLDELKRCYRLAVRDLHPDRNPELAADSAAPAPLPWRSAFQGAGASKPQRPPHPLPTS